jgi:hypothetical protein
MSDRLGPGESLPIGESLVSANGQYRLIMQIDGNLVLYRTDGAVKWATDTRGRHVGSLIMQPDGNIVMYDPEANPIWASATHGHAGAFLEVQDDGNVVLYHPAGGALWSTGTNDVIATRGRFPVINLIPFRGLSRR